MKPQIVLDKAVGQRAVAPDTALFRVYKALIALRKEHLRLFVDGALTYRLADDAHALLAYERALGDALALVAFNPSDQSQTLTLDAEDGRYQAVFPAGASVDVTDGLLTIELPARTARVWIRE